MKKSFIIGSMFTLLIVLQGCNNHPRDKTNLDDIIHCGFGQEYVSGYPKSNGTKVKGYCRDKN